ncbi:protocatechuate-dioxygenase beta subunit protein, putative [Rhizoctonia solani AG-3 Rhs1AP]|uniref:Protocatechuate-dioxygenase beta subunit protein, putative n=2 Tax=Rhizoctonia solani AG-3 TaxID=1086053 RepID=X8J370_9AGAM|nr:protocatechuate-dioxygenase beta subunit protein, putative [Rhizoctonia solani AG-3 Rhs1AP]KEP54833.1 putative protocatechuate-dioxygenase beta subunit protein [Rhizoctonia solani 123E]
MVPKSLSITVVGLAALATVASGHPGESHALPRAELHRRQLEANKRHIVARNCASQIAEFNAKRKAKRDLAKRGAEPMLNGRHFRRQESTTSTVTADSPTYTTIQNSTCVTTPEVTEGPYYINNELLRQDIREDQEGVDLILDIGVMDVITCQPLDQALVEIWHCNATGHYSGFTSANMGGGGGNGTAPSGNVTAPPGSMSIPTGTESSSAAPTGTSGGGGGSTSMTDQLSFLRGGYATNSEGMVEFSSVYPGFYTGRTVHIHTMVHTNYSVASNGSIISHTGTVRHIGQLFFDDILNEKIVTQGVYANTTETRTYNDEDGILDSENADGYNAYASTELLGETETDGVLAYITIGVDPTFVTSITSTNYASGELE